MAQRDTIGGTGQPGFGSYRFPQAGYEAQCHRSRSWPALPSRRQDRTVPSRTGTLLEQARKEPGTLLHAVHRSADDPEVFWTTEVHAAAEPVFTDLIAAADVTIGEAVMATGLDR